MKKTLVILAAGIGSRFGEGVKQLTKVGHNGEVIIDFSIHDAVAAGFDKIIFIIRKAIEANFHETIGDRMEKQLAPLGVEVKYAFQEIENIPGPVPQGRIKPWGTGHALLACEGLIHEPFAVINADDYYGKGVFAQAAEFLESGGYGMMGYVLKNTLSEEGGVTRAVCIAKEGHLMDVEETRDIVKTENGAESHGQSIPLNVLASMNFWCLPPSFMDVLKEGFPRFLKQMSNPLKDEYLLPDIIEELVHKGVEVTVVPTNEHWFGITYKDDLKHVRKSFDGLYEKGVYADDLYSDVRKGKVPEGRQ